REISHELVPARVDKIDKLQLEDRPLPIRGETARDTQNRGLRQRRIVNLLRKIGGKLLRQAEDATLRIFDVFAENDPARVFLEAEPQRFVDRITNTVFARREH